MTSWFRAASALAVLAGVLGSAASARSASLPPINTSPPLIAGSAVAGATLSCSQGQWQNSPTSYQYSWQRNLTTTVSTPAASNQYTLTPADVGQLITCAVTAANAAGSASATSPPIVPVTPPLVTVPIDESPPAISGNAEQGQTVTCTPGAWVNNPTGYSYGWQRNASNIAGQTSSQYTLSGNDVNQAITCTVVASDAAGSGIPAVSLPIIPSAASSGGGSGSSGGATSSADGGKDAPVHVPNVKSFSISPRRMVVSIRGSHERAKGETLRYTLDQAAAVWIVIERRLPGRLAGKRCRAATHRSTRARHCTRSLVVQIIYLEGVKAGNDWLHYTGRADKHLLPNGNYRVLLAAVNAAGWSNTRSASFTVVRTRPHRAAGRRA